ncbi:hypothetical protein AVEN_253177-1 [Araneus ventricosus]|uniref:Uncharacterized protein n=1 Tax=Araneus ventricosus TaxID=182803 RepID=A0A4Y2NYP8_ARAVE|nr:hypothetical protein AVEN_253177-1 [Araneus ventricosus]
MDALHSLVKFNSLKPITSPLDSLSGVFFYTKLLTRTNKSFQHPKYLRQAALEVINNIPIEATLIYTDGSKNEIGHTGSGGFVKHVREEESSLKRRNADHCSVFISEIIVIDMALDFVLEHQLFGDMWILSDSLSVVQYLDNWSDVSDRRGMDIFNKLKTLCNSCALHLQWTPSHYRSEGPGATIHFKGDRKDQTALTRLTSGHLKTIRISRGEKFNICTKCSTIETTPQHLPDRVALVYDDLLKRPDFMLEVMKAKDLMDLIRFRSEGLERRLFRNTSTFKLFKDVISLLINNALYLAIPFFQVV